MDLWAAAPDDEGFEKALKESGQYQKEEIDALLKVRLPMTSGLLSDGDPPAVPHIETGVPTGKARELEFPESFAPSTPLEKLPPVIEALPELRNPAVTRTLTGVAEGCE